MRGLGALKWLRDRRSGTLDKRRKRWRRVGSRASCRFWLCADFGFFVGDDEWGIEHGVERAGRSDLSSFAFDGQCWKLDLLRSTDSRLPHCGLGAAGKKELAGYWLSHRVSLLEFEVFAIIRLL